MVEPPVREARAELDRAAIKATLELAGVADNRADVVPTVKAPVPVAQDVDPAAVDRVVLVEAALADPAVRVAPIQKGCSLMRWSSMRTRTASSARKNSASSSKTFTVNNRADPVAPAVLVVVVPVVVVPVKVVPVKVVPVKVVPARAVPVETPRAMVPAALTVAPMKVANGPNGRGVPNEL